MPEYHFRPITRADFPMVARWLSAPHIDGWWGPAEVELPLIEEELAAPHIDMCIVTHRGHPFAYLQDYPAEHYGAPQYAGYRRARAIDVFLGDPAFLGQGHAAGFLAQRADELLSAGAKAVVVDPDPANARAIRTYAKAGFEKGAVTPCEDGNDVQVMYRRLDA
ncbi:MAG: GNAT family N-acetyltransferase [Pseudomonadota bacterium]